MKKKEILPHLSADPSMWQIYQHVANIQPLPKQNMPKVPFQLVIDFYKVLGGDEKVEVQRYTG